MINFIANVKRLKKKNKKQKKKKKKKKSILFLHFILKYNGLLTNF